ncbi:unnamed protein product [Blepharisma stoltei]|uniref:Attractin/MKLN-like beta-propeller domain-containing protein n=1 Tax=Blepharisma stoltei TaxID=1481888 RepID=A0AAU9IIS2_9CILI|nr:unnamed protein product [Blepharisma stoltei]
MAMLALLLIISVIFATSAIKESKIPETGCPPTARSLPSSVYDTNANRLLLFGGASAENVYYNDVWAFNFNNNQWQELCPSSSKVPDARKESASFFNEAENSLIIMAGKTELGAITDIWSFDLDLLVWKELELQNCKLNSLSSVAYEAFKWKGNIYYVIFGGAIDSGFSNLIYLIDSGSLNCIIMPNTGDGPTLIHSAKIAFSDGKLYIWGGLTTEYVYDNNLYIYDLQNQVWTKHIFNKSPIGRMWHYIAIYSEFLYIFPGFDYNYDAGINDIWKINLNDLDQWIQVDFDIDKNTQLRSQAGNTFVNSTLFQYSGSTYTNDLIYINISYENPKFSTLTSNWVSPPPRMRFAMEQINDKIAIFGGQGRNGNLLDDFWVYSVDNNEWVQENPLYEPSARYGHAHTGIGYGMVIFGGEDSTGLLNDFYIYSATSKSWSQIITSTGKSPLPAKGACIDAAIPYIFLYGGVTSSGLSNILYQYDITILGWVQKIPLGDTIPPLAWHQCYADHEDDDFLFYVFMGETDNNLPNKSIYRFSLKQNSWEIVQTIDYLQFSLSEASNIILSSSFIITIGGEFKNIFSSNVAIFLNGQNYSVDAVLGLSTNLFSHRSIYMKNDIYIFAGTRSSSLRINNIPTSDFIKLSLEDGPCSEGAYKSGLECIWCPIGTWSEDSSIDKCNPCPIGTINEYQGGASQFVCVPCELGTYNDVPGSGMCKKCPAGMACPVGSTEPIVLLHNNAEETDQPDQYSPELSVIQKVTLWLGVGLAIFLVFWISILAWNSKNFEKFTKFDIYNDKHNEEGKPMYLKRTSIGGFFSALAFIGVIYIFTLSNLEYWYNNVIESKTLLPYETLIKQAENFDSDITIIVGAYNYGGSCVTGSACNEYISWYQYNIISKSVVVECFKDQKNCFVQATFNSCNLGTGAYFYISFAEPTSYASYLYANVTADSSIPNEKSSHDLYLSPPSGQVFIGVNPSYMHFNMIPSLFISDVSKWQTNQTGFLVSSSQESTQGFSASVTQMTLTRTLGIVVTLDIDTIGVLTIRSLNNTFLFFISTLMGSISGIISAGGFLMEKVEDKIKKINERRSLKISHEKIINENIKIQDNFPFNIRRLTLIDCHMKEEMNTAKELYDDSIEYQQLRYWDKLHLNKTVN